MKVELTVDGATAKKLELLREKADGAPIHKVLSTALHLLDASLDAQERGADIVVREHNGKEQKVEFFF